MMASGQREDDDTVMKVLTPVNPDGSSGGHFGKAHWVAVGNIENDQLVDWDVHEVAWDVSHDSGSHGSHHARVISFLKDHHIEYVVAAGMGQGMARMLDSAKVAVLPATAGDAKRSVLAAVAAVSAK